MIKRQGPTDTTAAVPADPVSGGAADTDGTDPSTTASAAGDGASDGEDGGDGSSATATDLDAEAAAT